MQMQRDTLRVAQLIWGLFLYAVGIVLTVHANLGAAPWDVFHLGLSRITGITLGMTSIAVGIVIVAVSVLMKEHVGFGTLSNMILIGAFIDVLRFGGIIPEAHTFLPGLVMMIAGLFVIAVASFFYMGAGYGAGPRDTLMVVLARRTGRSVGLCRAIIEGTALVCGWLLGGHAGIGTVISAFGIGFAVQIVFTLLKFDVRAVRQETFAETFARLKVSR
jgi:uncharacterized membrane protein YczE